LNNSISLAFGNQLRGLSFVVIDLPPDRSDYFLPRGATVKKLPGGQFQGAARLQGRERFTHQAVSAAVLNIPEGIYFWYNVSEIVNSNVI
jgi:hypothetical protein